MDNIDKAIREENLVDLEELFKGENYNVNGRYAFQKMRPDYSLISPLCFSLIVNRKVSTKFFLDKGANVNEEFYFNETSITQSYCSGISILQLYCSGKFRTFPSLDIIKLFIDYGADITFRDRFGKDIIEMLRGRMHSRRIEELDEYLLCNIKPAKT